MPASTRGPTLFANLLLACLGAAPILLAAMAGHDWADRHFLPTFAWSRATQIGLIDGLRALVAALGLLLLLFVRPRLVRAVAAGRGRAVLATTLSSVLAVVLALAATEGILHSLVWRSVQERWTGREPQRQAEPLTGWTFVPNHRGQRETDGRIVDYATDRFGYRVGAAGDQTDPARPTIIFAGESMLMGYGLPWPQTIAAQTAAMTGLQPANLSVDGYAIDQTYLRLRHELPQFARPVAVVIPFLPLVFDRNLDADRPHLDAALRWHAAEPPSFRLVELARRIVRYRSSASIDEGVAMARAALRASIALANARGARAIILAPYYRSEDPAEAALRHRVLDEAGLPYLPVALEDDWRLVQDRHSNAAGAHAIALALARALADGVSAGSLTASNRPRP